MAGTSLSSQLQAIKIALNATAVEPEPGRRRPLTKPSILFDAKAAADIDIETIYDIALSGLEVLMTMEERFRNYKNDLFSSQSRDLDRELRSIEENKQVDASIGSYLRLLSGYLELHSALKTLEYLIRRYKIHQYNSEDLILCALPYHDTHVFVQIVQLIDAGNSTWKFLDGVKMSGARLPREVVVQQCIKDKGVLEAICNYGMPMKKIQPSKHVIGFCTAVIFEVLGRVTIDNDVVRRILPFVSCGLQTSAREPDQKAGSLMIVSLLAQKAALAPNIVKSLMYSIAESARANTGELGDMQWLRMSILALINTIQLQSVELIPKKTVGALNEIGDISRILSELTKEFNIDKFIRVFLNSLLEHSTSDDRCHHTLLSITRTISMGEYVNLIVPKLIGVNLKISQGKISIISSESGCPGKKILANLCDKYPDQARRAFYSFLKDAKIPSENISSSYDLLCKIVDGHLESSDEILDPKVFFAFEHSEAVIRRSAILGLDVAGIMREKDAGSKKFAAIQDAITRRLKDDDLSVVRAALNLKNLSEILSLPLLFEALQHVLERCIQVLLRSSPGNKSMPLDVAFVCLQQVVANFKDEKQYAESLATIIFSLVLIRPKTKRLNLKALELAVALKWPIYGGLICPSEPEKGFQTLEPEQISSINLENISKLAENFSSSPAEYIPWFLTCCNSNDLSKTLFFLILLQSLKLLKMDAGQCLALFESCFLILKREWERLDNMGISVDLSKKRILDGDCEGILQGLLDTDIKDLNHEILACLFLRFSEMLITTAGALSLGKWACMFQDLFLFGACHFKDAIQIHFRRLFAKGNISLALLMLKFFTEEGIPKAAQIESLYILSHMCLHLDESSGCQLLAEFPSVLLPLSSDYKDVRLAAMSYIEELFTLFSRITRHGKNVADLNFLGDLLHLIIQQKKMILSDKNVVASLFTSLLSSSSHSLLVPYNSGTSVDDSAKDSVLAFIVGHSLGLSAHAKFKIISLIKGVGSKLISVPGVKPLLEDLLKRRNQLHLTDAKLCDKLSPNEVGLLCLLLEICTTPSSSSNEYDFGDFILKALETNGNVDDSAILDPCLTILRNISSSLYGKLRIETQESIFRSLLLLYRSSNGNIQNSSRDALLRINLSSSVVGRVLDFILDQKSCSVDSACGKKRKKSVQRQNITDVTLSRENMLPFMSAFVEVVLMKKNIENRGSLIGPLFKLLWLVFMNDDWMIQPVDDDKAHAPSSGSHQTFSEMVSYVRQTLLLTLEDISASIANDVQLKDNFQTIDVQVLLSCARSSSDAMTRNHVFSFITVLAKIMPDKVLDHILDILSVIADSTVTQWDSYSQRVFEGLTSEVITCWLSRTRDTDQLLQIFVNILPQVAEHRRFSVVAHILRSLGEAQSLGSLLFLLFNSLISRKSLLNVLNGEPSSDNVVLVINKQWEYLFAINVCEQYSCTIWLPSLIVALKKVGSSGLSEEMFAQLLVTMHFIAEKLRDPEISYKFDSGEPFGNIQAVAGDLMEQVVCHLQLVDSKKKHIGVPAAIKSELKECIHFVLKSLRKGLVPTTYFEVIIRLVRNVDVNVRKKALGLLSETVKDLGTNAKIDKKNSAASLWLYLNEASLKSFEDLCNEILASLDASDDNSSTSLRLAAVAALEVLANRYPSQDKVFGKCLGSICKRISSQNPALSNHCLRATGALVNALGPKALPELPSVMGYVLEKSRDASNTAGSLFMSVLLALEAIVNKLAGFLNPHMGDILEIVVLHPLSFSSSELKLKLKAEAIRKLITEKIPVRLLLPPLLSMYSDAVGSGESSLSALFEMLKNLVGSMDRPSIGVYHGKIFDQCLLALDRRRETVSSIQNISVVEDVVINVIVVLTLKLTETMFRPLFIKTVEWSGIDVEDDENTQRQGYCRAISFYSLVNKLAESHRSLFVPYFKYLIAGSVRGLVDDEDKRSKLNQKTKKAKLSSGRGGDITLSIESWHLRALILSSLHKCFLYDSGSLKFLDSENFQVLLKPITSQLAVDPPLSIDDYPDVPSIKEVDDLLVSCVGQMAVTAGSDLLWKPLNHEVLMQTRSEKTRARILGLRIIRYLVDKLKEEYLTFLPESMPFLAELLEDSELPVKSLAQEIVREMEDLSGENLREYL